MAFQSSGLSVHSMGLPHDCLARVHLARVSHLPKSHTCPALFSLITGPGVTTATFLSESKVNKGNGRTFRTFLLYNPLLNDELGVAGPLPPYNIRYNGHCPPPPCLSDDWSRGTCHHMGQVRFRPGPTIQVNTISADGHSVRSKLLMVTADPPGPVQTYCQGIIA
jgi:hypothetical protein